MPLLTEPVCRRCIYDANVPGIDFDSNGTCNYCRMVDELSQSYGTGAAEGQRRLEATLQSMRALGRGKDFDCVIGISGGTDSSYLLLKALEWGLRPLAVHYDNTWNSGIASENIRNLVQSLDVEFVTHVVRHQEVEDIVRAFLQAGVPELEAATDLGYAYLLRQVARRAKTPFILEGHSFVAEGITPLSFNYFDGRYIRSIHQRFGRENLRTYPLMTLTRFLRSVFIDRPKFIRPLWYLDYSKSRAKSLLSSEIGWKDYGGHHLENKLTAYYHSVYLPQKFGADLRNNALAAAVRSGEMDRETAAMHYATEPPFANELAAYFEMRLGLTKEEHEALLLAAPSSWHEYPTYKRHFELLRPVFALALRLQLIPESFYRKYCHR